MSPSSGTEYNCPGCTPLQVEYMVRLEFDHPSVLVFGQVAETEQRWAACLQEIGARVCDRRSFAVDHQLDLVLTDRRAADLELLFQAGRPDQPFVVLGLGSAAAGDFHLPADVSSQELQRACRMLTATVRLSKQLHEGMAAQQQLAAVAESDVLTGLPNRRAWEAELQARLAACRESGGWLCVAIVDLDLFKQINDGWGLPAGDRVLAVAGQALRESLRQDDFVARLGGDEFGLLLSGLDPAAAAAVVERVRAGLPARLSRYISHVPAASAGWYIGAGADLLEPADLLSAASAALRRAKQQGRNQSVGQIGTPPSEGR
jgi:diguanylate cyclase (GGDEF)-like protein